MTNLTPYAPQLLTITAALASFTYFTIKRAKQRLTDEKCHYRNPNVVPYIAYLKDQILAFSSITLTIIFAILTTIACTL